MSYETIVTTLGQNALANAIANKTPLLINGFKVGDGNGSIVTPSTAITAMVNTRYSGTPTELRAQSNNVVAVECVVPSSSGGYTVREIGLFSNDDLICYGATPEIEKPLLENGAVGDLVLTVYITISDTSAVTLAVDPAIAVATRRYVDKYVDKQMMLAREAIRLAGWATIERDLWGLPYIHEPEDEYLSDDNQCAMHSMIAVSDGVLIGATNADQDVYGLYHLSDDGIITEQQFANLPSGATYKLVYRCNNRTFMLTGDSIFRLNDEHYAAQFQPQNITPERVGSDTAGGATPLSIAYGDGYYCVVGYLNDGSDSGFIEEFRWTEGGGRTSIHRTTVPCYGSEYQNAWCTSVTYSPERNEFCVFATGHVENDDEAAGAGFYYTWSPGYITNNVPVILHKIVDPMSYELPTGFNMLAKIIWDSNLQAYITGFPQSTAWFGIYDDSDILRWYSLGDTDGSDEWERPKDITIENGLKLWYDDKVVEILEIPRLINRYPSGTGYHTPIQRYMYRTTYLSNIYPTYTCWPFRLVHCLHNGRWWRAGQKILAISAKVDD